MACPKWRPRHPPKFIAAPRTCPTGRQRYASWELAHAASVRVTSQPSELIGLPSREICDQCRGYHIE